MKLLNKEIIRINETVNMIPQDVPSIIDLGCGDGRVLRALSNKVHKTGIDIDSVRIKPFPGNKIIGDISKLPIKSRKFDMVLCCEVLEHLDNKTLFLALEEIQRFTKRYISITVPFEETLSAQWCKCCKCAFVFHGKRRPSDCERDICHGAVLSKDNSRKWAKEDSTLTKDG